MPAPLFLVNNKLRGTTIVSETTLAGFGFSKALDGRTSTQAGFAAGSHYIRFDFGSAQTFKYIAYAGHNITGMTLSIASSPDFATWTPRLVTTGSDGVSVHEVEPFSDRYVQIYLVVPSGNAYISDFFVGEGVELPYGMPVGFVPPELANNDLVEANMTGKGAIVGINVTERPIKTRVKMDEYPESWVLSNWPTLVTGLKKYPVYFLWHESGRAMFGTPDGKIGEPKYVTHNRLSAVINLEGFIE